MVVDFADVVQENSQEGNAAEQQNSNSHGHGTQKKRRRVGRFTQVNSSQDSNLEEEAEEEAPLVTRMQMQRRQDMVITHLMFDGQSWHAKFACDSTVWGIEYNSLDAEFMEDAILKCKRRHSRLVEVPKGSVRSRAPGAEHSTVSQLPQIPSSEVGSVPGNLYCVHSFCQRNSFLLAFRVQFPVEKLHLLIEQTPERASLDGTFADKLSKHLGITTVVRGDLAIANESQFRSVVMAHGTSWMMSPVGVNGDKAWQTHRGGLGAPIGKLTE